MPISDQITTARPYAQALFRLGKETGAIDLWQQRLQRLSMVASDEQMQAILGNPKFYPRELASLFLSLSGEPDNEEIARLLALLAENGRLGNLPEVLKLFERLKRIEEGVRRVVISTAYPVGGDELTDLLNQLEKYFGHKLMPTMDVDPSLIGGIKVSFTDRVIDASIRGRLDAMAADLKN